jgi:hypothetical protein
VNPHELLLGYLADSLGRRRELLGEDLFEPFVLGLCDQLSAYGACTPFAELAFRDVILRDGAERSYIFASIYDRGRPLRLRRAMATWTGEDTGDYVDDWVGSVNARRWWFVNKCFHHFLSPLIARFADRLSMYYALRPGAQVNAGIVRICEDVDRTVIVAEIDDRSEPDPKDSAGRYKVQ